MSVVFRRFFMGSLLVLVAVTGFAPARAAALPSGTGLDIAGVARATDQVGWHYWHGGPYRHHGYRHHGYRHHGYRWHGPRYYGGPRSYRTRVYYGSECYRSRRLVLTHHGYVTRWVRVCH